MSKIAFFCIPAQGHTNPTLQVVRELVKRGNQVRYYSFDILKDKIQAAGAEYISCDAFDLQMKLTPEDGERVGQDIVFSTQLLVNTTLAMDDAIIEEMSKWKPDCIVADSVATWGKLAAIKLGVPFMSSTTTFAFNRYSAGVMKQSFSRLITMLMSIPKANKEVRRLWEKGYPVKNILSVIQNDNDTNTIVYTSPEFQPRSDTFSDKYTFIGPSINTDCPDLPKSSKKVIYISMGTVINAKEEFYRKCIEAFKDSDFEVILSVGSLVDIEQLGAIPEHFTVQHSVNQIEVLKKADVFLTHCGMNSVNEALFFKVPLVLFPQTDEQGGVAYRVNELGAGRYLQEPSAEEIKKTVLEVLNNPSYRQEAGKISESFQRCGGPALAADRIEALAGQIN